MKYKVLITTSGTGSRLGDITKYMNKSLVKIGKKPAISYIIESYPRNTEFIVTIGYFGNQVKDFLELVYPKIKFTFVKVDKYEGLGTSLGYSMLQAEKHLNCPFVFHASDTIIRETIPLPEKNWLGGYKGEGSSQYSSFDTANGKVQNIYGKGMIDPDFLHIGIVGIKDHKNFWNNLKFLYKANPNNGELNDVFVINKMIEEGKNFVVKEFKEWFDTGNVESLHRARRKIADSFDILDKLGEAVYIFDKFVVKFFFDTEMVKQRVARGKILDGLVPKIEGWKPNFYKYKYAKGDLYSDVAYPSNFGHFLDWADKNLWKDSHEVDDKKFETICHDFYYTKSIERINKFLKTRSVKDEANIINGEKVPIIKEIFKKIDFEWLCMGNQSNFHGDFILDNIIKTKDGYTLLDWRQNFGGLIKSGDMYYDLAKLNHNLTVNHGIVNKNQFTIKISNKDVNCDIMRKENLVECQKILFGFAKDKKYDDKKIRILTALIWLNMSPLHYHPFDLFLFYFGKLNLWRELKK
jgi:NDP-sugar pyrophosphorylase family protein